MYSFLTRRGSIEQILAHEPLGECFTDVLRHFDVFCYLLWSLTKSRRRRQRERHQTKDLMNRTIAVHVRYNSLYIYLRPLQNNNVK